MFNHCHLISICPSSFPPQITRVPLHTALPNPSSPQQGILGAGWASVTCFITLLLCPNRLWLFFTDPQILCMVAIVQWLDRIWLFAAPWTAAWQASCPSLFPRVCSNSCPLSWWCHPTISSSVTLFSFCLQSFLSQEFCPSSRLFSSGGQNIGASASVSALPMNIQGWFPLGMTDLISLLSKWLSKVFSSTTVWKHQFFGSQPSLRSHPYMTTGKSMVWLYGALSTKWCLCFLIFYLSLS